MIPRNKRQALNDLCIYKEGCKRRSICNGYGGIGEGNDWVRCNDYKPNLLYLLEKDLESQSKGKGSVQ